MRHIRPTFPSEFWIVADLSELHQGLICTTRDQVEDAVGKAIQFGWPWAVGRFGDGELGRDVSHEFVPDDADEWAGTSYDRAASAADAINDMRKEGVL